MTSHLSYNYGSYILVSFFCLLGVTFWPVSSQNIPPAVRNIEPAVQNRIDDFINKVYLPLSNITKLGLALVRNNTDILYTTGYGLADEEKGIPNGNDTQFLIASVTKSFTATLTVKVLHEFFPEMGEAVLDTPIRKLVPSANFTLVDRYRSDHGTFRDILAHRLCLFNDNMQLVAEPYNSTADIVYTQRYQEDICGIRSQFVYNNQMYVLAGELIGILANKTFNQLVGGLLKDIGMHNSTLASKTDDFSNMPFRAQPYYVIDNVSKPMNPDLVKRVVVNNAAGGLFVPPNDMVKYMRFHLNRGNIDGKQVISQEVMAWLTRPSNTVPSYTFKSSESDLIVNGIAYGLGTILASYDGWQYITHGGYFPTYLSLMSLFPSQNLGIFTSTNESPELSNPTVLHTFIFEVLKGNTNATQQATETLKNAKGLREQVETVRETLIKEYVEENKKEQVQASSDLEGIYGNGGSGEVKIVEKFNEETNSSCLYVSYGKWYHGWLESIGGTVYQITWDTDVSQDNFSAGDPSGRYYARIANSTLEFIGPFDYSMDTVKRFKRGQEIRNLPTIPWQPGSC